MFSIVSLDHARVVLGTDLDMQQAVNNAVRSAALSADELSQAYNDPRIDPDTAHMVFRHELASNLRLDEGLNPGNGSGMEGAVEYVFVVFNGENEYGLPEGVKYSSGNPSGEIFSSSLPAEFGITEDDILIGPTGTLRSTLNKPGCVATIKGDLKPILGQQRNTGIRWASAKIVQ